MAKISIANYTRIALLTAMAAVAFSGVSFSQIIKVDPKIPAYKKSTGISGNLDSIGSDTLNNLMTFWAESFRKIYPNVRIQIEGKGSSTAPPALASGTSQLGPMSRIMKQQELDTFEKKHGFVPTRIGVALDALAVYVHRDNPIEGLSLPQIDAIFSKTSRGGLASMRRWGDAGLSGSWRGRPISLYGRNSASGTYGYFKKIALFKGDFRDQVKEQPGSAAVINGVGVDRNGIGYSGIGYRTSSVRVVPLAKKLGGKTYVPSYKNVLTGKYPLARMLFVYVAKKPNRPLPPLIKAFLSFVLSRNGQQIVIKDGYLPLPAKIVRSQRALLK